MKLLTAQEKELAGHLKATIWYSVSKIVEQEMAKLSQENREMGKPDIIVTNRFIAGLVELVYRQLVSVGEDLESFAIHGSRSIIKPADLFMVTRRNDALTEVIKEYLDNIAAAQKSKKKTNDTNRPQYYAPIITTRTPVVETPTRPQQYESDDSFADDDDEEILRQLT